MSKKFLNFYQDKFGVIFFAAASSIYPIFKAALFYKYLPVSSVPDFIYLYALIAFIAPLVSLGLWDFAFSEVARGERFSAISIFMVGMIPAFFITIGFFIYINRFNQKISLLISFELLSLFIFQFVIRYIRSISGARSFFKYTFLRHVIELVLLLICVYFMGVYVKTSALAAVIANLATSLILVLIFLNLFNNSGSAFKFFLKSVWPIFLGIVLSSLFSQLDKMSAKYILSDIEYIEFGYYTFSKAIFLSFAAFMFSIDYRSISKLASALPLSYSMNFIYKRILLLLFLSPVFFAIHIFSVFYYFRDFEINYMILFSFFYNFIFLIYIFDVFQVTCKSHLTNYLPVAVALIIYLFLFLIGAQVGAGLDYILAIMLVSKVIQYSIAYVLIRLGRI